MNTNQPDEPYEAELFGFPIASTDNEASRREPLEALVSEFAERQRRGQNPSIEKYVQQYPELEEQIRELFPLVRAMEQWKVEKETVCLREGLPQTMAIQRLGEYRIIRELARGGMGVVFEAEHVPSGQRVAVKLLPWQSTTVPRWRERFEREAETVGRLSHPNIVPILDFGEYDGFCYYVMPFVEGVGLDWVIQKLRESGGVVYADEIARLRSTSNNDGDRIENSKVAFEAGGSPSNGTDDDRSSVADGPTPHSLRSLHRDSWRGIVRIGLQFQSPMPGICESGTGIGNFQSCVDCSVVLDHRLRLGALQKAVAIRRHSGISLNIS